jgi:hypothetical protein
MQLYRAAVSISLDQRRWAKIYAGSFPGAACCQPIELPHYKAAPLQALGMRRHVPEKDDYEKCVFDEGLSLKRDEHGLCFVNLYE